MFWNKIKQKSIIFFFSQFFWISADLEKQINLQIFFSSFPLFQSGNIIWVSRSTRFCMNRNKNFLDKNNSFMMMNKNMKSENKQILHKRIQSIFSEFGKVWWITEVFFNNCVRKSIKYSKWNKGNPFKTKLILRKRFRQ